MGLLTVKRLSAAELLAALEARRAELAGKLDKATEDLERHRREAREALIAGQEIDDDGQDRLGQRCASLNEALSEIARKITDAKAVVAAESEMNKRRSESESKRALLAVVEDTARGIATATAPLLAALKVIKDPPAAEAQALLKALNAALPNICSKLRRDAALLASENVDHKALVEHGLRPFEYPAEEPKPWVAPRAPSSYDDRIDIAHSFDDKAPSAAHYGKPKAEPAAAAAPSGADPRFVSKKSVRPARCKLVFSVSEAQMKSMYRGPRSPLSGGRSADTGDVSGLYSVCDHEARHAVCAMALGVGVTRLTATHNRGYCDFQGASARARMTMTTAGFCEEPEATWKHTSRPPKDCVCRRRLALR